MKHDLSATQELVLNYQGFRGKFHILEVRCENEIEGGRICGVAKQIQNRIGHRWGFVQEIDRSQHHREIGTTLAEVESLFAAADEIEIPATRQPHRGIDGTWYTLRIGNIEQGNIVSWWSDIEPELRSVYDLRNRLVETVMRLLRANSKEA